MKVAILCNSVSHPVYAFVENWLRNYSKEGVAVNLIQSLEEAKGGELLFLISCSVKVPESVTSLYKHTLVLHASDLPHGRGWSPHIWQVLEGKQNIMLSMLEAASEIDTGRICKKISIELLPTDLYDDINKKLFNAEVQLVEFAIENFDQLKFEDQDGREATYYSKRTVKDSELDTSKNIADQFNLMRVCDPERYPSYFIIHGKKYLLKLEKADE